MAGGQPVRFSAIFPDRMKPRAGALNEASRRGVRQDMGRTLRFPFVTFLVLLCSVLPARHAQSAPALERGTAITDPVALRELDHGRFGLTRVMLPMQIEQTRRSPTASCSLCRRWLPSARRSMTSSTDTLPGIKPASRTKPSASEIPSTFSCSTARCSIRPIPASCWRASSTGWTALSCRRTHCGEIRLIYRLTRTDVAGDGRRRGLAAPADDAQRRAEGQRRRRRRQRQGASPAPRSPAAGWRRANRRLTGVALAEKSDREGRPAGSGRAREHRSHRNQPSDRARAEIRGPRFSHRLSAEGVRLSMRSRGRSRNRRWKTRSIATGFWRMQSSGASSRRGCSIPRILPNSIAARS